VRSQSGSTRAGEFDTALTFAIEDGRIGRVHAIRDPQSA
jgi:hypothetical protein